MNIYGFSPFGYEGAMVKIEVDLRRGIPAVDLIGLADSECAGARKRVREGMKACGYGFPSERVLISLSPADLKKDGRGFDLPIAMAIYCAQNKSVNKDVLVMGAIYSIVKIDYIRGVYAACQNAKSMGINECYVPKKNAWEAHRAGMGIVHSVECLKDAFEIMERDFILNGEKA